MSLIYAPCNYILPPTSATVFVRFIYTFLVFILRAQFNSHAIITHSFDDFLGVGEAVVSNNFRLQLVRRKYASDLEWTLSFSNFSSPGFTHAIILFSAFAIKVHRIGRVHARGWHNLVIGINIHDGKHATESIPQKKTKGNHYKKFPFQWWRVLCKCECSRRKVRFIFLQHSLA